MKDNPHTDTYLYLFVAYLTAMPVVQIRSLTQENAVDLRSVGTASFKESRPRLGKRYRTCQKYESLSPP